jgi:hypothetical protein
MDRRILSSPGAGVRVEIQIEAAPTVGDPALARRLVSNLLDNAVVTTIDHGEITIATGVRAGACSSRSQHRSRDPRKRVAPAARTLPTTRQRACRTRSRTRPRLAITGAIATARHATLSLQPRVDGGLTLATFMPQTVGPARSDAYTADANPIPPHAHSQTDHAPRLGTEPRSS